MTVVVLGDLRIVPVRNLIRKDLGYRFTRESQVPHLSAVVPNLIWEGCSTCGDRQIRVRSALRGVRDTSDRVDALVSDGGHGEVGRARGEVLAPLCVTVRRVHDLDAFRGDVGDPLVDGICRPTRPGTF